MRVERVADQYLPQASERATNARSRILKKIPDYEKLLIAKDASWDRHKEQDDQSAAGPEGVTNLTTTTTPAATGSSRHDEPASVQLPMTAIRQCSKHWSSNLPHDEKEKLVRFCNRILRLNEKMETLGKRQMQTLRRDTIERLTPKEKEMILVGDDEAGNMERVECLAKYYAFIQGLLWT
ncbi:hypothetical protein CBS101457_002828 [Exobasidium rhododendri]|nr:hypothetical protein CBS101457_002828 [Exobasidium rhododendri]